MNWGVKGDLDYFATCLHLRHYNSNVLCDWCPADECHRNHCWCPHNFGPDALWKTNLYTRAQWRKLYDGNLHWLFAAFRFLSSANEEPDELHVTHLGTSMYVLGSVLGLLVYRVSERALS